MTQPSTYPGVREELDRWVKFVEYLPDGAGLPGYQRRLEHLTGAVFDLPAVFLLVELDR